MTTETLLRTRLREIGPVAVLLAAAACAWALSAGRMAGMDAGPGSELGSAGWFAVTWLVMMTAMMLPAITPVTAAYSRRAASAGCTRPPTVEKHGRRS